jgi:hypothetical protein
MKLTRLGIGSAVVAVLLIGAGPVRAHDPDTGRPNWITEGAYASPQTGEHCCGANDCERLDPTLVQATPRGFVLHAYKDELVPYAEATPSEDGKFWRCHKTLYNHIDGSVTGGERRCFFAPVGTE